MTPVKRKAPVAPGADANTGDRTPTRITRPPRCDSSGWCHGWPIGRLNPDWRSEPPHYVYMAELWGAIKALVPKRGGVA